ncbi:hypothetical protein CLD22_20625 [Rubrivivax gelatinosus]|nr:hypothetical protein [Rubrivivax gelatinosus]
MFPTPSRARASLFCSIAAAVLLSACGGGGGGGDGGDLQVEFSYADASDSVPILTVPAVEPTLRGLEGNTPHCTLSATSTLPEGVTMGSNCRLSGIATSSGTFFGTVTLSVKGYQGTLDAGYRFTVYAPSLEATGGITQRSLAAGVPLDGTPLTSRIAQIAWFPIRVAGDRWTLTVAEGSLPTGLELRVDDSGFVALAGTPARIGHYDVVLRYTLERGGRTLSSTLALGFDVGVQTLQLEYSGCCDAYTGVPMSFTPKTDYIATEGTGIRFALGSGNLPAGLRLDTATGTISGTPQTGEPTNLGFNVIAQVLHDGSVVAETSSFITFWPVGVFGTYPVSSQGSTARYASGPSLPPYSLSHHVTADTPFTIAPGPMYAAREGDIYRYRLVPNRFYSYPVPAWVAIDPVTGVISGTRPADTLQGLFEVELTLTRGGTSYLVNQTWGID